jgi:hypothetical protein
MGALTEDEEQRLSGFGTGSVTGALGSNASLDMRADVLAETADANIMESLDIAKALLQAHPDWEWWQPKWVKFLDLYMSNDIYRFLFRHLREGDTKAKQRLERGYYYNYVKAVVDLFTAFLFHSPIDRNPGSKFTEDFERIYKNADRAGTMWDVFWQRACTFSSVEGHVGILVDSPKTDGEDPETEAERKDRELAPYITMIHAHQIRDWEIDQFGNFQWVKIEVFRPMDRDWRSSASQRDRFFVIWTKTDWEEWAVSENSDNGDEVARLIDGADHDLGEVPLVILRIDKHPTHPWFGISSVIDIADINIAILNWSSLGDEEIYERCLNVLAIERGESDSPIELTHANLLEYEPGGNPPQYLEPGATALKLIMEWIQHAQNEIRRLAKLNISTGLGDVRQAQSGIAKAFHFIETNQSLAAKALHLEQAEVKVHQLILKWLDNDLVWDGAVAYPREFGIEDFLTVFQELDAARNSLTSETAIKESEKKVIRKIFARDAMKLREKIEKEIDDADMKMPAIRTPFGPMGPIPLGLNTGEPGSEQEGEAGDNVDGEPGGTPPNQTGSEKRKEAA